MKKKLIPGPLKAAFRQDNEAGVVRFFVLPADQEGPGPDDPCIATVLIAALDGAPGAFEHFKALGQKITEAVTVDLTGMIPDVWQDHKPFQSN